MGLGEEDHDIILLLLVASGITIILSIYQNQDGGWCGLNSGYIVDQQKLSQHYIRTKTARPL